MSERALETKSLYVTGRPVKVTEFGFAPENLAAATKALITAREAAVMVTWSGSPVSSSTGHYCGRNASCSVFSAADVKRIEIIREGESTALVTITLEIEE